MFKGANHTAGSLSPNVHQCNCSASHEAAETSSRQMFGQAWEKWRYHWNGIFPDPSNKFGASVFSRGGHNILLNVSNARGGFCPLVIIHLKYGSQNTGKKLFHYPLYKT